MSVCTAECDPRERSMFYVHATPFRQFALWVSGWAFKPLMQLEVEEPRHLPSDGGLILASNHVSSFDVFAVQLAAPRPMFFMSKAELVQIRADERGSAAYGRLSGLSRRAGYLGASSCPPGPGSWSSAGHVPGGDAL